MITVVIAACDDGGTAAPDAAPDASMRSITRTEEIPFSPECPASGTRVLVGFDDDGDGVLDDREVDSMTVACRELVRHEGDLIVRNAVDADAVRGINIVTGSLIVDAPNLTSVDLSALTEVGGDLLYHLDGPLVVPLLQTVGLRFEVTAWAYDAPRLVSVGGALTLATDFRFSTLARVSRRRSRR